MILGAPRLRSILLGVVMLLLGVGPSAHAAEPPLWKFEKGAKNRYRMTQEMKITMNLGPGGQESRTVTNVIDMSQAVEEAKPDGSAVFKQKIDRMRMKIEAAGGDSVEFDSQSEDEPEGFAAMIAPMVRELTNVEFIVTMTPRGKITAVEIPESAVKAIAAAPGAQVMGNMATADGLKSMIMQSSFELPETLEPGVQSTSTAEMTNPTLGKQTIKTSYRYVGPQETDGVQYEAFEPTLVIEFGGGTATVKINKQESSGEVLFNRTAGRLESTKLEHSLAMSITADGKTIDQSLHQQIDMKWLPDDAE